MMEEDFSLLTAELSDIENIRDNIQSAVTDVVTIEKIKPIEQTSDTSAELTKICIESIKARLNYKDRNFSFESIGTINISLDDLINDIWEKIKKVFRYLFEKIKAFFNSLFNFGTTSKETSEKEYLLFKEKVETYKHSASLEDFSNKAICNKEVKVKIPYSSFLHLDLQLEANRGDFLGSNGVHVIANKIEEISNFFNNKFLNNIKNEIQHFESINKEMADFFQKVSNNSHRFEDHDRLLEKLLSFNNEIGKQRIYNFPCNYQIEVKLKSDNGFLSQEYYFEKKKVHLQRTLSDNDYRYVHFSNPDELLDLLKRNFDLSKKFISYSEEIKTLIVKINEITEKALDLISQFNNKTEEESAHVAQILHPCKAFFATMRSYFIIVMTRPQHIYGNFLKESMKLGRRGEFEFTMKH